MKKQQLTVILLAGLIAAPVSAQFHVQNGASFHIQSSTLVSIDGLVLQPSTAHTLSNVTITRSGTAVPSQIPFGQSISRVYNFSAPVNFTGTLGIRYEDSELNGLTESWLQVATRPNTGVPFVNATNSSVNQTDNYVSAAYASTVSLGQVTGAARAVYTSAKAYLQGAYNAGSGRHKDVTSGWAGIITANALSQPYNYTAFGNYNGGEKMNASLAGPDAADTDAFDWVLLELKNASNTVIARRAALILENGNIVEIDGVSPVAFHGPTHGKYSLTVHHRNHLSIRSATTPDFGATPVTFDFTGNQASAYQNPAITTNEAMKELAPGKFGLWGGNANGNGVVNYGPLPSSDRGNILLTVGNTIIGTLPGYHSQDVNFSGIVNYGPLPSSDRGFILNTVLGNSIVATRQAHQ